MSANYADALAALAPTGVWSMTDITDYDTLVWYPSPCEQPTKEQCDAEIVVLNQQAPLTACKNQATKLLYETDWTTIADVANPEKSNPYLMNQDEFTVYRSQLRQLAVYPVATPDFPVKPTEKWSS